MYADLKKDYLGAPLEKQEVYQLLGVPDRADHRMKHGARYFSCFSYILGECGANPVKRLLIFCPNKNNKLTRLLADENDKRLYRGYFNLDEDGYPIYK